MILGAPALAYAFVRNVCARSWAAAETLGCCTCTRHIRIATEGVLLGSLLMHGINPELAIVSDDAGQFNVLLHGLCWIHAERVQAKLTLCRELPW